MCVCLYIYIYVYTLHSVYDEMVLLAFQSMIAACASVMHLARILHESVCTLHVLCCKFRNASILDLLRCITLQHTAHSCSTLQHTAAN